MTQQQYEIYGRSNGVTYGLINAMSEDAAWAQFETEYTAPRSDYAIKMARRRYSGGDKSGYLDESGIAR